MVSKIAARMHDTNYKYVILSEVDPVSPEKMGGGVIHEPGDLGHANERGELPVPLPRI